MSLSILILLPRIPFPLRDGGAIAMNQTLEELIEQDCHVSVLSMNTSRHFVEENDLPSTYKKLKHFKTVYINNDINPLSAFLNLFTNTSYNISRFEDKKFTEALIEILTLEKFDIVLFESVYTSMYLSVVQEHCKSKCFCRVHNIEYLIWQRLCEHEGSFFKRKYLELLTERLKVYELNVLKEFDLLLPISKNEEYFFEKEGINASYYLPFGISIHPDLHIEEEPYSIYHVGSMDWAPNLESMDWFLKEVWKELQLELPKCKFYIAGKKMPKRIFDLKNDQTIVQGEVDDVISYSANKQILVVPLLSGAGIRVKILEAMALGKMVVATPVAVEGIGGIDGVHWSLAETPEEFKGKISYYLNNSSERLAMGSRAKEFVQLNYQKEKIYSDLVQGFNHLM